MTATGCAQRKRGGAEEDVTLLSARWAEVFTQRWTKIPQRCGKSTRTHEETADDEIVGLFM